MMNFSRALAYVFAVIVSTFVTCSASAVEADPLTVKMKQLLIFQMDHAKDCNNIKHLDDVNLSINGIVTGLHALGCDQATGKLTFQLKREPAIEHTSASNALWESMLGNSWEALHTVRQLSYTVTQPGADTIEILNSGKLNLLIWTTGSVGLGGTLILAIWIALFFLGKKSGMVRDAGNPGTDVSHRPFSLGRVQMAWWFAIVVGSYIFLWMITGEQPELSAQALALMGLSGATGLTSAGLDASKKSIIPASSGNFFIDLLTDADGVTIYRFQMLALTILFGIFFFMHVVTQLRMPAFDQSILTLLGISAGTYAGFKIPEKHGPPPADGVATTAATSADDAKLSYTPSPELPAT